MLASQRSWIIGISITLHLGVGIGLYVAGLWDLERLEGRAPVFTGVSVMLPPPPPPAGGSPSNERTIRVEPKLTVVRTLVQPVAPDLRSLIASSDEPGRGTGTGKGEAVGDGEGTCLVEPCGAVADYHFDVPDLPSVPKFAQLDSETTEALRISGETHIEPSIERRMQMAKAKMPFKSGKFELCVSMEGMVSTVSTIKSTGFADYDGALTAAIRNWRYRPYTINSVRQPFCSTVTFHYHLDIKRYLDLDGYRFERDETD